MHTSMLFAGPLTQEVNDSVTALTLEAEKPVFIINGDMVW